MKSFSVMCMLLVACGGAVEPAEDAQEAAPETALEAPATVATADQCAPRCVCTGYIAGLSPVGVCEDWATRPHLPSAWNACVAHCASLVDAAERLPATRRGP